MRWPVDGVRNVIRHFGTDNEKIRRLKAEELVDDSVVRKFRESRKDYFDPRRKKSKLASPEPNKSRVEGSGIFSIPMSPITRIFTSL
jgi:hypothetical protein